MPYTNMGPQMLDLTQRQKRGGVPPFIMMALLAKAFGKPGQDTPTLGGVKAPSGTYPSAGSFIGGPAPDYPFMGGPTGQPMSGGYQGPFQPPYAGGNMVDLTNQGQGGGFGLAALMSTLLKIFGPAAAA